MAVLSPGDRAAPGTATDPDQTCSGCREGVVWTFVACRTCRRISSLRTRCRAISLVAIVGRGLAVVTLCATLAGLVSCARSPGSLSWIDPCDLLTEQQRNNLGLGTGRFLWNEGRDRSPYETCGFSRHSPDGPIRFAFVQVTTEFGLTVPRPSMQDVTSQEIAGLPGQRYVETFTSSTRFDRPECVVEVETVPQQQLKVWVIARDPCPVAIRIASYAVETLHAG